MASVLTGPLFLPWLVALILALLAAGAVALRFAAGNSRLRQDLQQAVAANVRLSARLQESREAQRRLQEQALRDPLTGLYNRRYLNEAMTRELARARRAGQSLGIVVIDLDRFKAINDSHGHPAGDSVLCQVAELLRADMRASDILCRFGGEEFVALLPGASEEVTGRRADQWRRLIADTTMAVVGRTLGLSASFGFACFPRQGETAEALIRAADAALYVAKTNGRNRVVAAEPFMAATPAETVAAPLLRLATANGGFVAI